MATTIEQGRCPVCNGSGRIPVPESSQQYKTMSSSYDATTDTFGCQNCGGQYMFGRPTGLVRLNKDGNPCVHDYVGQRAGRCYTKYHCQHCAETYSIDSGG